MLRRLQLKIKKSLTQKKMRIKRKKKINQKKLL